MRTTVTLAALGCCLVGRSFTSGQEPDGKAIESVLREIELAPSLYAKGEEPINPAALPKFAKLAGYSFGPKVSFDAEYDRWKKNRVMYTKTFPLRAVIFEAAAESDKVTRLTIPMKIAASKTPMKQKAVIHHDQEGLGTAMLTLEQLLARMEETAKRGDLTTNKRWRADFEYAMVRVQTNLIFLWEANYTLARVRTDNLPDLGPGQDGWKITYCPKLKVTESKAKGLAKDRLKHLQKIQEEHPDTPWAFFAERESKRDMGMDWTPTKR
jgi:hypothetical protein